MLAVVTSTADPPVAPTWRLPAGGLVARCPHCGRLHHHGAAAGVPHRVGDCQQGGAGYFLGPVAEAPAEIVDEVLGRRRRRRAA
jgi:uncharacterized protein (DUF983 family)